MIKLMGKKILTVLRCAPFVFDLPNSYWIGSNVGGGLAAIVALVVPETDRHAN